MHSFLKRFIKTENGNVAPIFAAASLPLFLLAGSAIDYSNYAKSSSYVLNAADAALLNVSHDVMSVVGTVHNASEVETKVRNLLDPLLTASLSKRKGMTYQISNVEYDKESTELKVDINIAQETTFLRLATIKNVKSTVTTGVTLKPPLKNAVSVVFVLDKSKSMSWYERWETMQTAMSELQVKFKDVDPDSNYIRSGLAMYDSREYPFFGMTWNMQETVDHFNTYTPRFGTNSAPSMEQAYNVLKLDVEEEEHKAMNDGADLRKVIVFMTDGDNKYEEDDETTMDTCDEAKADGIEIYSVSFGSLDRGRILLEYCASAENYFMEAENNSQLLAAFSHIGVALSGQLYLSH